MNVLGCLDRPTSGAYLLDGIDVASLDDLERTALRGRSIGFVFQSFHLLGHRTAIENVMLAEVYGGGEREGRRERALATLERVGMEKRRDFADADVGRRAAARGDRAGAARLAPAAALR